nr:probable tetraacyldisaccharide 4'-kinase, mitochondrial [Ipomoea trifida]
MVGNLQGRFPSTAQYEFLRLPWSFSMEKLARLVTQIAYTPPSQRLSTLSPLQLSLIPLLSFASSFFRLAVSLRHRLYRYGFLRQQRLPVPVISVGNLTWGGNGKTPMVEFLARWLADSGIPPLILTRGYGGADEVKMLERHLRETPVKIGVGANRAAIAASFFQRHGYMNPKDNSTRTNLCVDRIGAAVLDDGMQHLNLWRDIEIVMVNAMMPWGNHRLLPLGPLREPLTALNRADFVVVHHADLVSKQDIEAIESTVRKFNESVPIFFSTLAPLYFMKAGNISCKLSLKDISNAIILCVSAIGSADSFVQRIKKMGPMLVDRLDFRDHHLFLPEDIDMIRKRLQKLESEFAVTPIVVVTEKDYDRAPEVLKHLNYEVLVLCSSLQILSSKGSKEDGFKKCLRQCLETRLWGGYTI